MCKISIGVDIHGVLDTKTELFKAIMKAMIKEGNFIHIITGIPFDQIEMMFDQMDILKGTHYTHFFSIETYLLEKELPYTFINNHKHFNEDLWNRVKGIYCKKHNIDLMIDDSETYGHYFETPYALFKK